MSKGVLLDQRAEMLNLYHIGLAVDFGDARVYLHQTPMFHAASMGGIIGIPATGGSSVFVPLFEPAQVMDAIERYGVDWTMMVPTMIALVMNHPEFRPERLASLRDLVYGASPMPASLLDRLMDVLPDLNLWQGYGDDRELVGADVPDRGRPPARRPIMRSAGRPLMGVDVSVRRHDGTEAARGENGEVCARAGNLMREYWNEPEQTDSCLPSTAGTTPATRATSTPTATCSSWIG